MSKIVNSVTELVGRTPLVRLSNIEATNGCKASIVAKVEFFNPGGSAKDRVALNMIAEAEKSGALVPGSVIIEPTSGNTGIGLAMASAVKGYRTIFVMPDTMSVERRKLLAAYGAEVVLTEGAKGMGGSVEKANELAAKIENSFIPSQFVNPANPGAHYKTTGPEIWADTDGDIDIFVATVGTGGTLSGTGRYLKEQNPDIKVVGVEPAASPLLTKGYSGPHGIQGIGANFIPDTLDRNIYDEIIAVTDDDAVKFARQCAKNEGLLVGISSGAAICAAVELADRPENTGKTIVALLTDTGERYISSALFE